MAELTVAVLTDLGGAHLDSYFAALAAIKQVGAVVVADPSGASLAAATKTLGPTLTIFERDHARVLADHNPRLALVTLEAVHAPPVIQQALAANCHVLAEKPSCVKAEDFEPLVRLADMKHRHLMLAFANRMRGTVRAALRTTHPLLRPAMPRGPPEALPTPAIQMRTRHGGSRGTAGGGGSGGA